MKVILHILKYLLIIVVALIGLILVLGLFAPKKYSITKEITILKSQTVAFDYFSKIKNQNEYGVWFKMDPEMKQTFTGTDGTVGFVSAWESDKVGGGSQTISKVEVGKSIETDMILKSFMDFKAQSKMEATAITDSSCKVSWTMYGSTPYPFNAMSLFMSMDEAVGKDYEKGLASLKTILESKK